MQVENQVCFALDLNGNLPCKHTNGDFQYSFEEERGAALICYARSDSPLHTLCQHENTIFFPQTALVFDRHRLHRKTADKASERP